MDIISLIIQLVCGAVGGNLAGSLLKNFSLGTLGNSIVGILGGGIGGSILSSLGVLGAIGDGGIGAIIGQVLAGGAGGGILMVIVGFIRQLIGK
jgi:hypothetical protein